MCVYYVVDVQRWVGAISRTWTDIASSDNHDTRRLVFDFYGEEKETENDTTMMMVSPQSDHATEEELYILQQHNTITTAVQTRTSHPTEAPNPFFCVCGFSNPA